MIPEGAVLLGVQYLQQGGGGIAAVVVAQFIHFVQQQYGVCAAGLLNGIDDTPRHAAHVGLAVPADLGLILDSAQRNTGIAAAHRLRNAANDGGFPDTGRPHKAKDLSVDIGGKRPDGQCLQHTLLYLFQAVVLLIQQLGGFFQVDDILGIATPRQLQAGLQIPPDHRSLLRIGGHLFHVADFLQQLFLVLIGGQQRPYLFPELIRLLKVGIAVAQLLIDDAELLPQVIIPLVFIHGFLHTVLDIRLKSQYLIFRLQQLRYDLQPAAGAVLLQYTLLIRHIKGNIPGYVFGDQRRIIAVKDIIHDLLRHSGGKPDIFVEQILYGADQRIAEGAPRNPCSSRIGLNLADRGVILLEQVDELTAVAALHQYPQRFPLRAHDLADLRHRSYFIQTVHRRVFLILIDLRHKEYLAVAVHCHIQRMKRLLPAYIKVQYHMRE